MPCHPSIPFGRMQKSKASQEFASDSFVCHRLPRLFCICVATTSGFPRSKIFATELLAMGGGFCTIQPLQYQQLSRQQPTFTRKVLFHCILGKAACLCTSISCAGCTKYTRSWATWSCSNARCARNAFQRFIRATSRPLLRGCSLLVATRLPRGKRSQCHRDSFWRLCTKARASVVPTTWLASPTMSSCEALQFSDRQT